jgi:hypothetical protein
MIFRGLTLPSWLFCRQSFRWMSYFVPGAHPVSYAFFRFTLLMICVMLADRIEPLAHGLFVLNILWTLCGLKQTFGQPSSRIFMIMILSMTLYSIHEPLNAEPSSLCCFHRRYLELLYHPLFLEIPLYLYFFFPFGCIVGGSTCS